MILASSGHPLLFLSALSSAILSIITCKQKTAAHKQMSDMLRELIIHLKDRSQMPLKCQSLSHPIRVESNWGHKKSIIKMSHQPVQLPVVVIINTVLWPNVTTCWSFWAKKSLNLWCLICHRSTDMMAMMMLMMMEMVITKDISLEKKEEKKSSKL